MFGEKTTVIEDEATRHYAALRNSLAPASAKPLRRTMETVKSTTVGAFLLLVCVVMIWGVFSEIGDAWAKVRADDEFRTGLVAASQKSSAHYFLVSNWLQCSPLLHTRAGCYASIRGAAASRGEEFLRQVDAAAMELALI